MIAKSSGICPLCSVFIAKSQSHIRKLPVPIPPLTIDGRCCVADGKFYYWDGRRIGQSARGWAHEYCVPHYAARVRLFQQVMADWQQAGLPLEAHYDWLQRRKV